MWNRTATTLTPGDIVMVDDADAELTGSVVIGSNNSTESNVVVPTAAREHFGRFGVFVGDVRGNATTVADDAQCEVVFRGRVVAAVDAAVALGDGLMTEATKQLTLTAAAGNNKKIVAIAKGTTAGAGTVLVDFDGLSGFGTDDS
jgi:hypothetical protein